jgi:acyl-coenzyme A thioesterase PaaI-like protein
MAAYGKPPKLTIALRKLYDTGEGKSTCEKEGEGMRFESYGKCFVCGDENPGGLRLRFEIDKDRKTLKTTFVAGEVFQGFDGVVHGGIVSTLLDEAMAKLAYELGYGGVTAVLEIRFRKPAPILTPLFVHGEIVEVRPRLIRAVARMTTEDGTVLATARSTLMRPKED